MNVLSKFYKSISQNPREGMQPNSKKMGPELGTKKCLVDSRQYSFSLTSASLFGLLSVA
jgi:hypothetical protein